MDDNFKKKLNGYFIAFCRRTFAWSPAYRIATKKAEVKEGKILKWRCAKCGVLVGKGEKHRDHIRPVVDPATGWNGSWDTYRDRMGYDEPDNLQILCLKCHKEKTNGENKLRKRKSTNEL